MAVLHLSFCREDLGIFVDFGLKFFERLPQLGYPGRGPVSGSPRWGPRRLGGRAGRVDLFRPQGAIGQGPEGPRKDGRVSLDFIRPRIRPRPFL